MLSGPLELPTPLKTDAAWAITPAKIIATVRVLATRGGKGYVEERAAQKCLLDLGHVERVRDLCAPGRGHGHHCAGAPAAAPAVPLFVHLDHARAQRVHLRLRRRGEARRDPRATARQGEGAQREIRGGEHPAAAAERNVRLGVPVPAQGPVTLDLAGGTPRHDARLAVAPVAGVPAAGAVDGDGVGRRAPASAWAAARTCYLVGRFWCWRIVLVRVRRAKL